MCGGGLEVFVVVNKERPNTRQGLVREQYQEVYFRALHHVGSDAPWVRLDEEKYTF